MINSQPHAVRSPGSYRRLLTNYVMPQGVRPRALAVTMLSAMALHLATPMLAGHVIDRALDGAATSTLVQLSLLAIIAAMVAQALTVLETWLAEHVAWTATNQLRLDLTAHLLSLDARFYGARPIGELIERIDGDVGALARFFSRFVIALVGNAVMIAVVLIVVAVVDWNIAAVLFAMIALAFVVMAVIRKLSAPRWAEERQTTADYYGFIGERIGAIDDIRTSGAIGYTLWQHLMLMRRWLRATRRSQMMGYGLMASAHFAFSMGLTLAMGVAAMRFQSGALTLGAMFLVFRLTSMLRRPTQTLRNEVQELQQADAAMARVFELLDTQPTLASHGRELLPHGSLAIEFDGVTFGYGDEPTLHDISLVVPQGTTLGVIGRTGAGKTTLARLIARFYDPDEGILRIGGIDIRDVTLADLRTRIGMVTQDVQIIHGSLRDNVTLFDPGVPDERIVAALRDAGMGEWLDARPDGLDSMLASAGADLSAGEAQLLTCARLMLRRPDIVILDEASARLDPATDRALTAAFRRLIAGRTAIVIAHRLSTLAWVDAIAVMEQGRIVEHGARADLAGDAMSRYAALLERADEEVRA